MSRLALSYFALCFSVSALPLSALGQSARQPTPEQAEFFEERIRPVLVENCQSCHGEKRQRGDLRLDSPDAVLRGNDLGPVIVPGSPEKSRLVQAINYHGEIKMPPDGKLPDQAIADLTEWVKMGAPWPTAPKAAAKGDEKKDPTSHWAFQPVKKPAIPSVQNRAWIQSPIDAFVLAKLESKGMHPAPQADRRTLIRRLYFDLIGLPPSFEEVEAFVRDRSPDAVAKVVDKLLASPHYGERWARHWLDVARYADTKGYVFQEERRFPYSYTYRDYVIRAFNSDLPFDRFLMEQLAADRLVAKNPGYNERALAAMGYLTLGRRFLNNKHDIIDDRIDVVTRGMLGLTVACARCHDHKYDPIPTADYYSLYGVFASSYEPNDLPAVGEPEKTPEYLAFKEELDKRVAVVEEFREKHKEELAKKNRKFRDELRALQRKVDEYKATAPGAPPRAMVLYDNNTPFDPYIFKRGKAQNRGPSVPRQFLEVLSTDNRKPFTQGSGRLELAQAIASRDNPLTARVFVNRVWMHYFGEGLVRTPSDFGLRADPPTHPELLDYLATYFMDNGWSVKKLHRLIVLSSTYQQSSTGDPNYREIDPDNRLLWKVNRRRLDFEALRDALLAVSGNLDLKMGGRSVDITTKPYTHRRTVYAFIERQNLPGIFRTFDFASPDASTPQRYETTVPQQALFLMNHPFVIEQAKDLLDRPEFADNVPAGEKIQRLYQRIYGRNPDMEEMRLALEFVNRPNDNQRLGAWEQFAQVLLLGNEFAFVD